MEFNRERSKEFSTERTKEMKAIEDEIFNKTKLNIRRNIKVYKEVDNTLNSKIRDIVFMPIRRSVKISTWSKVYDSIIYEIN